MIGAIVATCDRPALLSTRSIPSILNQSRPPDLLVIVDDSRLEENRKANADFVNSLHSDKTSIAIVQNRRTPGVCGAWNTGIDWVFDHSVTPESTFLAFLDDDDAWLPAYLESCQNVVEEGGHDMVSTDFFRIKDLNVPPMIFTSPPSLIAEDFLVGNPGVQGSNLFLRLSTMLMAGCFDEAMMSSNDRDLCIRISDLGTIDFVRFPEALVQHYVEAGRNRLSTRGCKAKISGLTSFWRKYGGRMDARQKSAFRERAERLFSWFEPSDTIDSTGDIGEHVSSHAESTWSVNEAPTHDPFNLLVGVITSEPSTVRPLLDSIGRHCTNATVLLLDNGCSSEELEELMVHLGEEGRDVQIINQKQQQKDAERGLFGRLFVNRPEGQVGIAQARTMIQRYLGRALVKDQKAIGWLLDDDMRIDRRAKAYLPWLPAFQEAGVHVLIGAYEGASPNPPLNGLRVQLVDLAHNLRWLDALHHDELLPNRSDENLRARHLNPDYYYDLSRKHTNHLENPHWFEPAHANETVGEARARLLDGANRLLNGLPLTRPLVVAPSFNPVQSARDSVNRGGCTFILDSRALTLTPNCMIRIDGREARRSDMMWAIMNRYFRGLTVKAVEFPVNHVVRDQSTPTLDLQKVQAEIIGSAMYAGLTDFLHEYPRHNLVFSNNEIIEVQRRSFEYRQNRLSDLERSLYRIRGLLQTLRTYFSGTYEPSLIQHLEKWCGISTWSALRDGVLRQDKSTSTKFLATLSEVADNYATSDAEVAN